MDSSYTTRVRYSYTRPTWDSARSATSVQDEFRQVFRFWLGKPRGFSIVVPVHLDVLVIGHGVQQPQNVFAGLRVETV